MPTDSLDVHSEHDRQGVRTEMFEKNLIDFIRSSMIAYVLPAKLFEEE